MLEYYVRFSVPIRRLIMNDTKIECLITECKQIEEDSTYTAEVHYNIYRKKSLKAKWLNSVSPVITLISGIILIIGVANWVAWITIFSALMTGLNIILDPEKEAREHIFAAKNYTCLKHNARSLYECYKDFLNEDEFYNDVKRLREQYNLLVQYTPATGDKKAWEEPNKRIKAGVHKADFRSEEK